MGVKVDDVAELKEIKELSSFLIKHNMI